MSGSGLKAQESQAINRSPSVRSIASIAVVPAMPDISADLEKDNAAIRHGFASDSAKNVVLTGHVGYAETVISELINKNEKAKNELETSCKRLHISKV